MIANAFGHGSTITDPPYTFVLVDDKDKPVDEVYGDFVQGDITERYDWLVHQRYGVTLALRDEFYAKNDPIIRLTNVATGQVAHWSRGRGIINGFKEFKVASVSSNYNAFGLKGIIVLARDGEAYEAAANDLNVKPKGAVVRVPVRGGVASFVKLGWEIPRKLDAVAPPAVVSEVWG